MYRIFLGAAVAAAAVLFVPNVAIAESTAPWIDDSKCLALSQDSYKWKKWNMNCVGWKFSIKNGQSSREIPQANWGASSGLESFNGSPAVLKPGEVDDRIRGAESFFGGPKNATLVWNARNDFPRLNGVWYRFVEVTSFADLFSSQASVRCGVYTHPTVGSDAIKYVDNVACDVGNRVGRSPIEVVSDTRSGFVDPTKDITVTWRDITDEEVLRANHH